MNHGLVAASIGELMGRQQPGFSLEQPFYTDPAIFELDMAQVYSRQWQYVGHISRIPQAGDFFLYNFGRESIIIIRGDDRQVHALFNVCRHRGSRLCLEQAGTAKNLVCPYHSWVYATDGKLVAARHMPEELDKQDFGLARAHVQVVEGLIFICPAEEPPEFATFAGDIVHYFGPHRLAEAKIAYQVTHLIEANWKLVAENYWECYHCAGTHPEYCSTMSFINTIDSPRLAKEQAEFATAWTEQTAGLGHVTGRSQRVTDAGFQSTFRFPIHPGYLTQSEDGQPLAPLMGDFKVYDGGMTRTMSSPLIWFVACNDYAMLARFTPINAQQTEQHFAWLVHPDAVEGVDFDPMAISWLWRNTAEQDKILCEINQAGVNSSRYRPGPYFKMETESRQFVEWYLRQLAL